MKKHIKKIVTARAFWVAIAVFIWLSVWQTVAMAVGERILLASPLAVIKRLFTLWREDGFFGVKDYNGIFVSEERGNDAGSVVTPSVSGNRCMPVEIQTLLSKTVFGMPRRMPLGIDYNRSAFLLAVLEKRAYMPFYT